MDHGNPARDSPFRADYVHAAAMPGGSNTVMRCVLLLTVFLLQGCGALPLTALGMAGSAGLQHHVSAINYRTFSTPLPKVRSAVHTALDRMAIKVASREKIEGGERILARVAQRDIEIELEYLTPKTTRMRSSARYGLFMDGSTASEIIQQTEKVLKGV
jgi:hypothetical protein